ncbi:Gfo/Idh/MocA family protein [Paenibacillus hodogayensis]|uniref:Gfo/Idh/MocA family protein n=1 Tax=Paenibacillus hodogayensis TaxID=279208 RepID=A0ABV5W1L2_9BACL
MTKRVRLAVVGGNRGFAYYKSCDLLSDLVEVSAICDLNEDVFSKWKRQYPDILTFTSFERLLADDRIDAVLLATPMELHASQSVQAMRAGKHVLCEVASAQSVDECWELVQTVEQTGAVYMLAENFCYTRKNLMVRHMAESGVFGELTHAECGYIHDVRTATHGPEGQLKWRGEMMRQFNGNNYPTHSLGPVSQWLGINRGDAFDYMTTIVSKPAAQSDYFRELFGSDHPGASMGYWQQGDSCLSLIRTKQGAVIYLRNDFSSPRPFNYLAYELQGTKGAFVSGRDTVEEPLVWLDGRGPGKSYEGNVAWSKLSDYESLYEHPWWQNETERERAVQAARFGDYFVMKEFATAILERRQPDFDVYDAVAVSSVMPLSAQSAIQNGVPVSFPNFAKNKPSAQMHKEREMV